MNRFGQAGPPSGAHRKANGEQQRRHSPTVRLRAGWWRRARVRTSRNSAIGLEFHSTHRAMRPMMRRAWPCRTRRSRSFRLQARFRGSPRAVPRNGWYKLVLFGPQCKHMPRNTTDGGYFTADLQPCNHNYHWKKSARFSIGGRRKFR